MNEFKRVEVDKFLSYQTHVRKGRWSTYIKPEYTAFQKQITEQINRQNLEIEMPYKLELNFYIAMPKSWSKKKKDATLGAFNVSRPDYDNLTKGIQDLLCDIEKDYIYIEEKNKKPKKQMSKERKFFDDCQIATVIITKKWSETSYFEYKFTKLDW